MKWNSPTLNSNNTKNAKLMAEEEHEEENREDGLVNDDDEQEKKPSSVRSKVIYCLKSLRTLFIVTIIVVALSCVISTSLIGFGFFYTNITQNINNLRRVNFETITVHTVITLETVSALVNNIQGMMPLVNFSSVDDVRAFTWQVYKRSSGAVPVISSFYCGLESGNLAGFVADSTNTNVEYVTNYANIRNFYIYNVTNKDTGDIEDTPSVSDLLTDDVLFSNWYQAANQTSTSRWSLSYTNSNFPEIMWVTLATAMRSTVDGRLIAWCAVDVATRATGEFLRQATSGVKGNVVIIIERQTGYMIACSDPRVEIFEIIDNITTTRFNWTEANNPLVRASLRHITQKYGANLSALAFSPTTDQNIQLQYESFVETGRVILLNIGAVKDGRNLDWLFIQAIPKASYYGTFYRSVYIVIIMTVVIIVISLVFAILLGICVAKPLAVISKEMTLIANMNFQEVAKRQAWFTILSEVGEMLHSLDQMKQGLKNFEKYVPAAVVQHILRTNKQVQLGVTPTFATIMFLDIENFTTITESLQPADLIDMMQVLFTHLSSIISKHSGVIDKYMGDSIMALFNAPTAVVDHEYKATSAALKMHDSLQQLNSEWSQKGYPHVGIRVGINTATCLIGNVGSEQRVNYTALGDGVNIASRLEGLNKHFNTRTMIGPMTYEKVKDQFACRWVSYVVLKGKSSAIHAYEVMCHMAQATPQVTELCKLHLELRDRLDRDEFEDAERVCKEILARFSTQDNPGVKELLGRMKLPNFTKFCTCVEK